MNDFYYPGLPRYIGALETWFYKELRIAFDTATESNRWRLLLGCLVHGRYVKRFLEITVPSLMADGNLSSIPSPMIVIHTDAANKNKIQRAFESYGCSPEVYIVPDDIIEMSHEYKANKYWLLGAVHQLQMQQAKYRNCGYHMLGADHVYARGFFHNLKRLVDSGEKAVIRGGLSAKLGKIRPYLKAKNFNVSPEELNGLALDHLHPQFKALICNNRNDLPFSTLMLFFSKDTIHAYSPHQAPLYLSNEVLRQTPLRLFNTIDGQLPWLIPENVKAYVPPPDDGIAYIEVSDVGKRPNANSKNAVNLYQWTSYFWALVHCDRRYERFLQLPTVFPLPRGHRLPVKAITIEDIHKTMAIVFEAVSTLHDSIESIMPEDRRVDPIMRASGVDKPEQLLPKQMAFGLHAYPVATHKR